MKNFKNPTALEVKAIFRDTYIFYTKWNEAEKKNWEQIMEGSRVLTKQYPFRLCMDIVLEIVSILEKDDMGRVKNG